MDIGFFKAGWVHDLQLHQFKACGTVKFVVGKSKEAMIIHCTKNTMVL